MQAGAHFAVGPSELGSLTIREREDGHVAFYVGNVGRVMDHVATELFDVTTTRGGFASVYESIEHGTRLVEVDQSVHVTLLHDVPSATRRVVATDDRWYVASDAEVHMLVHRTDRELELLTLDAIDVAASSSLLCVVEPRGLAWFDRNGALVTRRSLASPTAIARDVLGDGWLVAADGEVLQLASPTADPIVLARGVGLATRIRRDPDTLYASVDGELLEVVGIRDGATTNKPRTIAAYAPGFSQFDALFELYVDEGNGRPQRFYVPTRCGCRTRSLDVVDSGSRRAPDSSCDFYERHRCPQCGDEWNQGFGG